MKRYIKRITAAGIAGLAAVSLAACGTVAQQGQNGSAAAEEEEIIRVGFVYPKSGDLASFGTYSEEWTGYVVDKANEAGIIIDGKKAEISLITADSQSDPKEARKAATQLIDDKNIDIMITSKTADTTVPVSEICEKKGVVCLSVDTPDEAWAVKDHKYSFHAGFDTAGELESFRSAWEQAETNGRVGVLHANDSEGSTMIGTLPDFAEKNGYVAYDPGSYLRGKQSFQNIIRNLKTQKVEILAGVMSPADFANFYAQLKEDGYLENIKVISVAKAAVFQSDMDTVDCEGLCTEVWWRPDFPTKSSIDGMSSADLAAQFTRLTGEENVPAAAGYDYANIEILYAVLNQAGTLDRDRLVETAQNLPLETVIGKVQYNDRHYSVQPLATGQWVTDADGSWKQNIISAGSVEGLQVTDSLQPLQD